MSNSIPSVWPPTRFRTPSVFGQSINSTSNVSAFGSKLGGSNTLGTSNWHSGTNFGTNLSSGTAATTVLGGSSAPFSASSGQSFSFGVRQNGSRIVAYTATNHIEECDKKVQSLSAMPNYKGKSHEELRLEDYNDEDKGQVSKFPLPPTQTSTKSFPTSANIFLPPTSTKPFPTSANRFPISTNPFPTSTNAYLHPTLTNPFSTYANIFPPSTSGNPFPTPTNAFSPLASATSFTIYNNPSTPYPFSSPTASNPSTPPTYTNPLVPKTSTSPFPTFTNPSPPPTSTNPFPPSTSINPFLTMADSFPTSTSTIHFPPATSTNPFLTITNPFSTSTNPFSTYTNPSPSNPFPPPGFPNPFPTLTNPFPPLAYTVPFPAKSSTNPYSTITTNPFLPKASPNPFPHPTSPSPVQPLTATNPFQPPTSSNLFLPPTFTSPTQPPTSTTPYLPQNPDNSFANVGAKIPSLFTPRPSGPEVQTTNLRSSSKVIGQITSSQGPAVESTVDQPLINANPFGKLPEMACLSIKQPSSNVSVQYGISSMPVHDKPSNPVRFSPLLTSRHLSLHRIRLPVRKYDSKSEGPKVPFFNKDVKRPSLRTTTLVPRENPGAFVLSAELWPHKSGTEELSSGINVSLHENEEGVKSEKNTEKPSTMLNVILSAHKPDPAQTKMSKEKSQALMPQLSLPDYYTKPSIKQLVGMEKAEPGYCGHVNNFEIGRYGFGNIKFMGDTNVRNLSLDSLVEFNYREVVVYKNEDKKPPVGEGLNKEAEVTLLNINCVDKKTGAKYVEGPKVEKYKEMLIMTGKEQGVEFISYDPAKGEWKFKVPHF